MNLPIIDLTPDRFAPYGQVIAPPTAPPDAAGPGWRWWAETALLPETDRPYAVGYLDLRPALLTFDWAERHLRSAEVIVPVGGDCLVYVAPPDHPDQPARRPPLDRFEVFRVRSGRAVLLAPGVWHGAPLAIDRPLAALVLLRQGTGTDDVDLARFADTPLRIEDEGMAATDGLFA